MTKNNDKEFWEFNFQSEEFINQFTNILSELVSISSDKTRTLERRGKIPDISDYSKGTRVTYNYFIELIEEEKDSQKAENLNNAMFIYLFSCFEKMMNDLISRAFKFNKQLKLRYSQMFVEADERRIKDGYKSFRDDVYENMSEELRDDFKLKRLKDVLATKSPMQGYKFIFGVPSERFEKDNGNQELIFNYNEIRERRNLLIHRGNTADRIYENKIDQFCKSSKFNKVELLKEFQKKGFLKFPKKQRTKSSRIQKGTSVTSSPNYFFHVFTTLTLLYIKFCSYSHDSIDTFEYLSSYSNKLLNTASDLDLLMPLDIIQKSTVNIARDHFSGDFSKLSNVDLINFLLSAKEIQKKLDKEKSFQSLMSISPFQQIYEILNHRNLEGGESLAFSIFRDDIEESLKFIETLAPDPLTDKELHEWFIFRELHDNNKFKEIFKTKFGYEFLK